MSAEPATAPLKQTPLHAEHVRLGGRMVPFGGWSMPVQYAGILQEHQAVRTAVGLFDISHMGQFFASGPRAATWLERMLTNRVARLEVGECQYTFLLNPQGGVIDDLIVYRLEPERYLLVVNASKIEEDFAWLQQHAPSDVLFEDRSADFVGIAVQGPHSVQIWDAFFGAKQARPARNEIRTIMIDDAPYYIARTGYTGEDGFEVFCPAERGVKAWNDILARGAAAGIQPCGLGARDTLRLEMCYPLNGSDLAPDRTPLEAGLSIFVDLTKEEFVGRAALLAQKEAGIPTRLVPFKMKGATPPPRPHYRIFKDGALLSEAASGTQSPSLGAGIGMAYLPAAVARIGEEIEVEIRGKLFPATIERKPLYTPRQPAAPAAAQVP